MAEQKDGHLSPWGQPLAGSVPRGDLDMERAEQRKGKGAPPSGATRTLDFLLCATVAFLTDTKDNFKPGMQPYTGSLRSSLYEHHQKMIRTVSVLSRLSVVSHGKSALPSDRFVSIRRAASNPPPGCQHHCPDGPRGTRHSGGPARPGKTSLRKEGCM